MVVQVGGDRRGVYVKQPIEDRHNRGLLHGRLETEFHIMKRLSGALSADEGLHVVAPIALLAEQCALVTLETAGPTLQTLVTKATRYGAAPGRRDALRRAMVFAGTWLTNFQHTTATGKSEFDTDGLLEYCGLRLHLLSRHPGSGVDAHTCDRLMQGLEALVRNVTPEESAIAGRHNDYAPHNIVVNEAGIWVLDFSMYDEGPICYDVCNFWLKLEGLKASPMHSAEYVAALQSSFLSGYAGAVSPESAGFRAARCRFTLARMLTLLGERGRGRLLWPLHRARYLAHRNWLYSALFGSQ